MYIFHKRLEFKIKNLFCCTVSVHLSQLSSVTISNILIGITLQNLGRQPIMKVLKKEMAVYASALQC